MSFVFVGMLVSYGYYNKVPETLWIETAEIYSLTVLEAKSLKSVSLRRNQAVGRTSLPLQALQENQVLDSFSSWWLPTFFDLWLHQSSLQGQHP